MRRDPFTIALFVPAMLALAFGSASAADQALLTQARALFQPLPKVMDSPENPVTPAKIALGRLLFFEPRVSVDGTVSCARCHLVSLYATDALPKAIGALGRPNPRNAPTVLNAALQFVEHWRGDRKSVEDQAMQALIGPPSFGNPDYGSAMAKLKAIYFFKMASGSGVRNSIIEGADAMNSWSSGDFESRMHMILRVNRA